MSKIGCLSTRQPIEKAMREVREWLQRIDVDGLSVVLNYDARQNVALLRFSYNSREYEYRSVRQNNCRLNMHGIARVIEAKVRAHLMGIEEFAVAMSPYLRLESSEQIVSQFAKEDVSVYAELGMSPLASNEELLIQYRHLAKSWHPDLAGSEEARRVFEEKFKQLGEAWQKIKAERGMG